MLTPKILFCGPQCAESVELSVVAVGGVNGEIAMSRTGNDSWMLFSNCWCTSVFVFTMLLQLVEAQWLVKDAQCKRRDIDGSFKSLQ